MQKTHSVEERKHALRLSKQACGVIQLIMQYYNTGEYDSIVNFYNSQTYELLSNYNTKLWWHSIYAIFEIYKTEKETGSVFNSPYIFGESA
jgi:hypothetical protein